LEESVEEGESRRVRRRLEELSSSPPTNPVVPPLLPIARERRFGMQQPPMAVALRHDQSLVEVSPGAPECHYATECVSESSEYESSNAGTSAHGDEEIEEDVEVNVLPNYTDYGVFHDAVVLPIAFRTHLESTLVFSMIEAHLENLVPPMCQNTIKSVQVYVSNNALGDVRELVETFMSTLFLVCSRMW
jgi:hypothetical protein